MFKTYLLISIIVLMVLFGLTYAYSRYYEKEVNLRLKNNFTSMILHPAKFFLILIAGLLMLTIILNILPILDIKDTVVNEDNSQYYSLQLNDYDATDGRDKYIRTTPFSDYDISYNDEGMSVIVFGDDSHGYGNVNEALSTDFPIYSQIILFDQQQQIIWNTQESSPNNYELIYDNHSFDARAVEFLNDGNIAVFGLSIDLESHIVYQTIVILDINGVMVELIDLDISEYGFSVWGGHYGYGIVSTEDGFTVEYGTRLEGSVMIHFNEHYMYEWDVINDENQQNLFLKDTFLETLVYSNHAYYVLNDDSINKYDNLGNLIWEKTYDKFITGFDVFDNEIVILSRSDEEYVVRENLFKLRDSMRNISYINVSRIDIETGEIIESYDYQYNQVVREQEYEIINLYSHYTVKDELGNYYVLSHDISSRATNQVYLILKFDPQFNYIGFNTIDIDGIESNVLYYLLYKSSNYIEDNHLYMNGVLAEYRVIIDLDELSFSEKDLHINIDFYNHLLTIRVYTVNVMLYLLIGVVGIIVPIYLYFTKNDDDHYIDENSLREKYCP
jgi:hypothetical protein